MQEDEGGDVKKITMRGSTSKLDKSVQDLVCMIFDVESMKKAMKEFEVSQLFTEGLAFSTTVYNGFSYYQNKKTIYSSNMLVHMRKKRATECIF